MLEIRNQVRAFGLPCLFLSVKVGAELDSSEQAQIGRESFCQILGSFGIIREMSASYRVLHYVWCYTPARTQGVLDGRISKHR